MYTEYGHSLIKPDNNDVPQKAGYMFGGYYIIGYEGKKFYFDSCMNPTENTWELNEDGGVIYAEWLPRQYTVTLKLEGYTFNHERVVQVYYNSLMPIDDWFIPEQDGKKFVGYYSGEDCSGTQYYKAIIVNDSTTAQIEGVAYYYRSKAQPCFGVVWNIAGNGTLYAKFETLILSNFTYDNYLKEDDSDLIDKYISTVNVGEITHQGNKTITASTIEGYEFVKFIFNNSSSTEVTKTFKFNLKLNPSSSTGKVICTDTFYALYKESGCVATGTLITLADGTQKPVEQLIGNEQLLVWNLFTGQFDTAPILFIDSEPARLTNIINLTFSDGTTVKVIYEHGFWDYNLNEYVYLGSDAGQYIGHYFNKQVTNFDGTISWEEVQLINVHITQEYTTAWSPVTYGHLCYYVNGMLSMPSGITGTFNIFEVDEQLMKYDTQAMDEDIAQYGLYTYEEFSQTFDVSEQLFNAVNGQYLKVAIGKGLITKDAINQLIERYANYLA